ncbi:MAG: hypothetical protein PVJ64_09795 [Gemmatimonadales bacterium]|jgi:Tol biopolymer transport system component
MRSLGRRERTNDPTSCDDVTGVNGPPPPDGPSPEGIQIAFQSLRGEDRWDIYVIEPDGSNPLRLTNDPAWDNEPAWSPDGTKIAFVAPGEDIYTTDIGGPAISLSQVPRTRASTSDA